MYDADWLVNGDVLPRPDASCLILALADDVPPDQEAGSSQVSAQLAELRDLLLRVYPSDHSVTLVRSAPTWLESPSVVCLPLVELHRATAADVAGASLFIPRLLEPRADNLKLVSQMLDPAHFDAVHRRTS